MNKKELIKEIKRETRIQLDRKTLRNNLEVDYGDILAIIDNLYSSESVHFEIKEMQNGGCDYWTEARIYIEINKKYMWVVFNLDAKIRSFYVCDMIDIILNFEKDAISTMESLLKHPDIKMG